MKSVSCMCPAFGRLSLLEEAIESFLQQDYEGSKELFVLNDAPWMKLELDIEDVYIINNPFRYETLGEKLNALHYLTEGEIRINWPSDDIFLPHAIRTTVELMGDSEHFAGAGYWYSEKNKISQNFKGGHCAGIEAFTPWLFDHIGGYSPQNSGSDQQIDKKIKKSGYYNEIKLTPEQAYFIYRWGTGHYHLSGYGPNNPDAFLKIEEWTKKLYPEGTYNLIPHWNMDYVKEIENARQ